MKITNYTELRVWKLAMKLAELAYEMTEEFPQKERYGLVSHLRRAALSIPSNIAEGHERRKPRDFIRFILISLGSLAEVETQMEMARRLGFVSDPFADRFRLQTESLGRQLQALRKALERRLETGG